MDVTVKGGAFAAEMALAAGAAAKKETIPALQYVLVETDGADGLLLTATDLDVTVRTACPGTVHAQGGVLLPARRLHDLARLIPGDADVRLQVGKKADGVLITANEYQGRLQALAATEFPTQPKVPVQSFQLPAKALRAMVAQVAFSVASDNQARYFTAGAYMALGDKTLRLVSTDGHRLSLAEATRDGDGTTVSVLVPRKALGDLQALLEGADTVEFATDENHLFFTVGQRMIVTRVIQGEFPAYERLIPKDQPHRLVVDRDRLLAATRRVALMVEGTTNTSVRVTVTPQALALSGTGAEIGEAAERLAVDYDGTGVVVALNGKYIQEMLAAMAPGNVAMSLTDDKRPVLFEQLGEAQSNYRHIIMPVRL